MSDPAPAPAPQPAPPATTWIQRNGTLLGLLSGPICVLGLIAYDQFARPKPTPYVPPYVQAAKDEKAGFPGFYHDLSLATAAGIVKDKKTAVERLATFKKPFDDALDAAVKPYADETKSEEPFTNATAAAKIFQDVAEALK